MPLDPSRVLVLAATRRGAGEMRDQLASRAARTVGQPLVRTAASVAHGILARRASAWGEPAPTLVSGPEQDRILAELIEGHLVGEGVPLDLPPSNVVAPDRLCVRLVVLAPGGRKFETLALPVRAPAGPGAAEGDGDQARTVHASFVLVEPADDAVRIVDRHQISPSTSPSSFTPLA